MRLACFAALLAGFVSISCSSGNTGEGGSAQHQSSGVGGKDGSGGGSGTQDTWSNYAKDFFATYCVSCHDANDPGRNFNLYSDVRAYNTPIRCGVAPTLLPGCSGSPMPKQFPIGNGPKPSDAERDRIVAWIQAGIPQ